MSTISATAVKEIREMSGAGMMDCKKALTEASGNLEKAIDILRKTGIAKARKKSGRSATNHHFLEHFLISSRFFKLSKKSKFSKNQNFRFFENVDFFEHFEESENFRFFFSTLFLKIFFDQKKNVFFSMGFFKTHLLVEENRFEAISERSQQLKTQKSHEKEMLTA